MTAKKEPFTIDFGTQKQSDWFVVNDGVMGGLSNGSINYKEDSFEFKGTVSLENNGGFASVRSSFKEFNLGNYKEVELRYRLSGLDFAVTLANSKRWYNPNYKANLDNTNGDWKTIRIPLLDFEQYQVGKATGYTIDRNILSNIIRISIISNQKKEVSFELEVDYIKFL